MREKEHIRKIYPLLDSIMENKARYIEVLNKDGEIAYKMKLILETEDMVKILDNFFDDGFSVREISKENFDGFNSAETFNFHF
jgi:hypothetical protein